MLETAAARGRFVACLAPGPATQWLVTPSPPPMNATTTVASERIARKEKRREI